METKQTAVDWLLKEINERNGFIFTIYYEELFNQAKAMEKEQIIYAFDIGVQQGHEGPWEYESSEQYYSKTYGN
jgi:hypothetical protein